jgi:hypothetical protein
MRWFDCLILFDHFPIFMNCGGSNARRGGLCVRSRVEAHDPGAKPLIPL